MKKTFVTAAIALSLFATNAYAQCIKKSHPEQPFGTVIVLQPLEARILFTTQYPHNTISEKVMFWTSHAAANLQNPGAVSFYGYTYQNTEPQLVNRVNGYETNMPIDIDLMRYPYAVYAVNTTNQAQPIEFSLSVEYCSYIR